jgi:hypothetical protein
MNGLLKALSLYFSDANLASPSLNMKILKGWTFVTKT